MAFILEWIYFHNASGHESLCQGTNFLNLDTAIGFSKIYLIIQHDNCLQFTYSKEYTISRPVLVIQSILNRIDSTLILQ